MARKQIFGLMLTVAGGLLALLFGLSTLAFILQTQPLIGPLIPLIIGGAPTAAGVALFWAGLSIYRNGRSAAGGSVTGVRATDVSSRAAFGRSHLRDRVFDRALGVFLVGNGVLIFGFGAMCTAQFLRLPRDGLYTARLVWAPVIGGFPLALGVSVVLFGWSICQGATPGQETHGAKLRDIAFAVFRIGVGGLNIWLSGLAIRGAVLSGYHGVANQTRSESIMIIGLAIVLAAIGGWLIATGTRSILSVK